MAKVEIVGKLYFIVDESDSILVYNSMGEFRLSSEDIEGYLSRLEGKFRDIQIFISDKFLFCLEDFFTVKKRKDALSAAKFKLETLLHSTRIVEYFSFFNARKTDDGFNIRMFYSESRFSHLLNPIFEKFSKKVKIIRPLWDIFQSVNTKGYIYAHDYITVFGENGIPSTFPLDKYPFELNDQFLHVEKVGEYLKNFVNKEPQVNFKEDDSIFCIEKIFAPAITAIIAVNLIIGAVLIYKYPKSQNEFLSYKKQVAEKMKELEPLNQTKDEKDKFLKRISTYKQGFTKNTFIPLMIRDLSKDMPDIYIENFRYNSPNLSITVNNVKSQEVIEYLKSRKYVKNVNINGKVSVFNDKERFNLGVQFAE